VALAQAGDPAAALRTVDRLDLDGYLYFHSTRSELLRRLGRDEEARGAYSRALNLATSTPSGGRLPSVRVPGDRAKAGSSALGLRKVEPIDSPVGAESTMVDVDVRVAIGEFSRMTYLSVNPLRLYHEGDILEPADIPDSTTRQPKRSCSMSITFHSVTFDRTDAAAWPGSGPGCWAGQSTRGPPGITSPSESVRPPRTARDGRSSGCPKRRAQEPRARRPGRTRPRGRGLPGLRPGAPRSWPSGTKTAFAG
jgi:hypothetical protein